MAMPRKSSILALGAAILTVVLAWLFVSEFLEVDRCLDAGGSFNYASGQCDFKSNHPYVSFWSRYWSWVAIVLAITAAALGLHLRQRSHASKLRTGAP